MESVLKRYEFEIKTKAPVFIGNGSSVGKKEYILDRKANKIYIPNLKAMYQGLDKMKLLPAFQEYMLKDTYGLYQFMRNNQIKPSVYQEWMEYVLPIADQDIIDNSTKEILQFVKDPYGYPYVPGSSLKGSLRTIFVINYYLDHPVEADRISAMIRSEQFRGRNGYHKNTDRQIAIDAFHRQLFDDSRIEDMQNDIMRGIIISDSAPIDKRSLCICQKIDRGKDGMMKRLNLMRECIMPETSISFQLTIDRSVCDYKAQNFIDKINRFYEYYQEKFSDKFQNAPRIAGNKSTFFLGGGSGYVSKTATYSVLHGLEAVREVGKILNNTLHPRLQNQHRHLDDVKKGVSPHVIKCTRYNGKEYQMGACIVKKMKLIKTAPQPEK